MIHVFIAFYKTCQQYQEKKQLENNFKRICLLVKQSYYLGEDE
jgi:hypothetical protein